MISVVHVALAYLLLPVIDRTINQMSPMKVEMTNVAVLFLRLHGIAPLIAHQQLSKTLFSLLVQSGQRVRHSPTLSPTGMFPSPFLVIPLADLAVMPALAPGSNCLQVGH